MSVIGKIVSYTVKNGAIAAKEVARCRKYPSDVIAGYQSAKRLSKTKNMDIFQKAKVQGTSFVRQTNRHLPGLLAGIATPFPILGSSALAYMLGKFLQKFIKRI